MKLSEQITGAQEDFIHRYKMLVQEFQKIQDQYFAELQEKTGLREGRAANILFDFVYNDGSQDDFAGYLMKLGS